MWNCKIETSTSLWGLNCELIWLFYVFKSHENSVQGAYWSHQSIAQLLMSHASSIYSILVYLVAMVSGAVYYRRRRTRKTRHSGPNFRSWRAKKDKCKFCPTNVNSVRQMWVSSDKCKVLVWQFLKTDYFSRFCIYILFSFSIYHSW